ncbi:MAG: hypothetical protein RLZZ384_1148 [Pseudomonadota bacterium]
MKQKTVAPFYILFLLGSVNAWSEDAPVSINEAYTKVCNSGQLAGKGACAADPVLGTNLNQWGCTRDNKTKLIWELKNDYKGLRDKDWTYTWYDPDMSHNSGYVGAKNGGDCIGSECDTHAFIELTNKKTLCGASNWRLPTKEELASLIDCSDNQYTPMQNNAEGGFICTSNAGHNKVAQPTINTAYFPNTVSNWFWTSSPSEGFNSYAWYVSMGVGKGYGTNGKYGSNSVRLVRNEE